MPAARTTITVSTATLARLHAEIQFLLRAHTEGALVLPNAGEGFGLDALLNRLLDAVVAHRRRAVLQRARRKAERKGPS